MFSGPAFFKHRSELAKAAITSGAPCGWHDVASCRADGAEFAALRLF